MLLCNRRVLNRLVEIKGDSIYDVITLLGSTAGAVFLANVFFLPLLCSSQSPTLFSDSYPYLLLYSHNPRQEKDPPNTLTPWNLLSSSSYP
jgi:hypothetical protein